MAHFRISTLRGKIFALVVVVLLGLTATIMTVTRHDVTHTVLTSERRAINNVMDVLRRELDTRWEALLAEKIEIVTNGKQQLRETGQTLLGVVASYAELARRGAISDESARSMARAWINHHIPDGAYDTYVYDEKLIILAANRRELIDRDLTGLKDIKGRPFKAATARDADDQPSDFALYRWPGTESHEDSARYAYFAYFSTWNWVLVVDNTVKTVLERTRWRRLQMERSLSDTLAHLTLAQAGFVMILNEQGRPIVPAPPRAVGLLSTVDQATKRPLAALLQEATANGTVHSIPFTNDAGAWLVESSYFSPLKWTLVGIVPQTDLDAPAQRLLQRQAWAFAGALALALTLAWLLAARLASPLHQLATYALQLSRQDPRQPALPPPEIVELSEQHEDEAGHLAASFLQMAEQLVRNVRLLVEETSTRERFESELHIAREIQLGLLPIPLPDELKKRIDLHALMIPAKEVGGDLYDYFMMRDGRLCIAIGDVSDKGIPAALFMAVTRTLIRAVAEDENDPAMIVSTVNDRLAENNPKMMFVTLMLATIDPATRHIRWVSAGHPPGIQIASSSRIRPLPGRSGPACGIQSGLEYRSFCTQLHAGEVLLNYTDGVTEAMAPNGDQYGEQRLFSHLSQAPITDCSTILKGVLADVNNHVGTAEKSDDITLIAVRIP